MVALKRESNGLHDRFNRYLRLLFNGQTRVKVIWKRSRYSMQRWLFSVCRILKAVFLIIAVGTKL